MASDDVTYNMYFSGQSFMGVYDIGAAQSMIDHAKQTMRKVKGYAGNAAGAVAACMVLTSPGALMNYLDDILRLSDQINQLPEGALNQNCDIINDIKLILQSHLRQDAHVICDGRLYVPIIELVEVKEDPSPFAVNPREDNSGLIHIGGRKCRLAETAVVSNFCSREDLIEVLLAAIYQPYNPNWTIPKYKGKLWMDVSPYCVNPDGLQNIPFSQRGRLITIAPNKQANQVRPLDSFTLGSMDESVKTSLPVTTNPLQMSRYGDTYYPPKRETLLQTFRLGAEDGKQSLKRWNIFERGLDSYEAQNPYH